MQKNSLIKRFMSVWDAFKFSIDIYLNNIFGIFILTWFLTLVPEYTRHTDAVNAF